MFSTRSWGVRVLATLAVGLTSISNFVQAQQPPAVAQRPQSSQASGSKSGEPVLLVSISELARSLPNVNYILRVAGSPEIGGMVTLFGNQYTQGLDTKRPSGIAVSISNAGPVTVAFLPLQDRKKLFESLSQIGGTSDLGDGLFEIAAFGQKVYAKEKGSWLFVAQKENHLASTIADPAALIKTMSDRYDLAFKVAVQNLPTEVRQMALAQIKEGYQRSMAQQNAGKSAEEIATAEAMGKQSIEQLERAIDETDQLIIGWSVDTAGKKTFIDIGTQFIAGSTLEKDVAAQSKLKTKFPAFQNPDAAASLRFSSHVSQENFQQLRPSLDAALANGIKEMEKKAGGAAPEFAKQVLTDVFNVFVDTLKGGTLDGGLSLTLNPRIQMVSGGTVANGRKLESSLKDLVAKTGNQSGAPTIKFDAYKHQGVSFHLGKISVPAGADPTARKVFGDQASFVIGTADNAVYFALGEASETALKSILDKNAAGGLSETTPMDLHLELRDILTFASAIQPNAMLDSMLTTIEKYAEKDSLSVTSRVVERGLVYRITVEEGILQAAGSAAKSGRRGGGF